MRGVSEIEAAFNCFMAMSTKVKKDSDLWVQFVSSAGVLGWVLGAHGYSQNTDTILAEIRNNLKDKVTLDLGGEG